MVENENDDQELQWIRAYRKYLSRGMQVYEAQRAADKELGAI